jgi:hypothetical protein
MVVAERLLREGVLAPESVGFPIGRRAKPDRVVTRGETHEAMTL